MRNRNKRGFTIIEVMVVIAIIGLAGTIVGTRVLGSMEKARVTKSKADISVMSQALKMYRLDNGFYPSTEQGLMALIQEPSTDPVPLSWKPDGYLDAKDVPVDPWGTRYIYRTPGTDNDFDIISLGADRAEGGEGYDTDIINM
jgi:general secretion pathway protein G